MVKKKNNNLWYILGGVVIVVLILWIVFVNVENNKVVCNSPYIQVGQSCCLDENYNQICDNEESEPEPQTNYRNFEVKAYMTHDFGDRNNLPPYPSTEYPNYPIWDHGIATEELYDAGLLFLYTNYDEEKITCYVKEYYEESLNGQFTMTLFYGNFDVVNIGYEKNNTPNSVRYDYECIGGDSNNKYLGSYRVHPKVE